MYIIVLTSVSKHVSADGPNNFSWFFLSSGTKIEINPVYIGILLEDNGQFQKLFFTVIIIHIILIF